MELDIQLSPHFSLREMVASSHRTIDNTPVGEGIVSQLTLVAQKLLEPIRAHFGPLRITSGYRCRGLNEAIGGASNSAHTFGCAADFVPVDDKIPLAQIVRWVRNSALTFDQVIEEHSATTAWVHIGKLRPGFETTPRYEALVMRDGRYSPWREP
jgi:zinc D-Ala-D-Ala carboxypeptidase